MNVGSVRMKLIIKGRRAREIVDEIVEKHGLKKE